MTTGISRLGEATGREVTNGVVEVTDTATKVPASPTKFRIALIIQNMSPGSFIYIGGSSVTTSNGIRLNYGGGTWPLNCNYTCDVYAICASGETAEVRYIELIQ
jgi:hypothetical protein